MTPRGLKPDEAESFVRLGAQAFAEDEFAGALAAAQLAVKADPNHFAAYALLAASLARLKHLRPAIEAYIQALRLEPTDVSCWTDLGELYVLTMQYEEAAAALRQAMQLDPDAKHASGRRARAIAGRTMALLNRG